MMWPFRSQILVACCPCIAARLVIPATPVFLDRQVMLVQTAHPATQDSLAIQASLGCLVTQAIILARLDTLDFPALG